ncbi:SDR family NAD(P)-dependent oxidoreductase [Actinomycetospora sp. TBRC 11914]|uniref:SDR family NAD(P)-dependent oxidoreductase n=1 Tax=Actinomycetospora sp. TBRC 11914 TaxID=2729387 RepID=UPI00145DBD1D|nr:SDR family NAD(P)-dependent oxidoreductase [Actinomycetospora sp. TBRC 11914]NMO91100.1 SDR family oxidoreductase [Actinomycetospora sp. TBRC 11914]
MDLGLDGARAIVTGASRGIGLACAQALAGEGASVALVARSADDLERAAATVEGTTLAVVADTTDDDAVRAMVARVVREWGGVDVLVNAAARPAGGGPIPPLTELTDDAVTGEFDTKVMGYLRCARAVAPSMIAQGAGRIVNISGLNARRTGSIAGTIRNVAVAALTANLADELGPHGIGATCVHPGMTETERIPQLVADQAAARGVPDAEVRRGLESSTSLRRLITAAEVADVVVFLSSPRSVAITGDSIGAGGGQPGVVHY